MLILKNMQSQNETAMISTLDYFHLLKINQIALIEKKELVY